MKWIKIFSIIFLLINSFYVYANPNYRGNQEEDDTYIGLGYKHYWVVPKGDWKKIVAGNTPGFDIHLGWRFHPNFALECGYEWTIDKPTNFRVPGNTGFLGVVNGSTLPVDIVGKVRFKSGYIDLDVLFPIALLEDFAPEGIVAFGIASVKPEIKIEASAPPGSQYFLSQIMHMEGRSKALFRLGFGIQSLVFGDFGIRALWRFENFSALRARNTSITESPVTRELFNNGQTLFLGIYARL